MKKLDILRKGMRSIEYDKLAIFIEKKIDEVWKRFANAKD